MSGNSTRFVIILLTLATAIVHGVLLNLNGFSLLFTLNALGYLGLLGAFVFRFPPGREAMVHYALMAYAAITIVAWVVSPDADRGVLGLSTKLVELLLIFFLWVDLGRVARAK